MIYFRGIYKFEEVFLFREEDDVRKLSKTHLENIMDKIFYIGRSHSIYKTLPALLSQFHTLAIPLRIAVNFSFSFDLDTSVITCLAFSLL